MKTMNTILLLLALPLTASASDELTPAQIELFGSANVASVDFASEDGSSTTTTTASVSVGGGYFFTPFLEANLSADYSNQTEGGPTVYGFLVGPTFNFSAMTDDSPYAGLGVGARWSNAGTGNSQSQFIGSVFLGKRFPIASHVTWSPQISFTKTGEAGTSSRSPASTEWLFSIVRISVLL